MGPTRQIWYDGPVRVRSEPPGLGEAIAAAQDLASDPEEIAALAAGFMGLPVEDVRPHVPSPEARKTLSLREPRRVAGGVVVETVRRRTIAKKPPVLTSKS